MMLKSLKTDPLACFPKYVTRPFKKYEGQHFDQVAKDLIKTLSLRFLKDGLQQNY